MPEEIHPSLLAPDELVKDCEQTFTRRSGPGGQHRNKTSTAVVLTHRPSGISAEAAERRSQAQNRSMALTRLRLKLALQWRTASEEETASQRELLQRYRGGTLRVAASNPDHPAVLAAILDAIYRDRGDLAPIADRLSTSPSQIARFLRATPPALQDVNRLRQQHDRRPLK